MDGSTTELDELKVFKSIIERNLKLSKDKEERRLLKRELKIVKNDIKNYKEEL